MSHFGKFFNKHKRAENRDAHVRYSSSSFCLSKLVSGTPARLASKCPGLKHAVSDPCLKSCGERLGTSDRIARAYSSHSLPLHHRLWKRASLIWSNTDESAIQLTPFSSNLAEESAKYREYFLPTPEKNGSKEELKKV